MLVHTNFIGIQVSQHAELMWLLSCRTPTGWLNTMTQWKVGTLVSFCVII